MNVLYNVLSGIINVEQKVISKISNLPTSYVKYGQTLTQPSQQDLNHIMILTQGQNQGSVYRCDYINEQYVWTNINPAIDIDVNSLTGNVRYYNEMPEVNATSAQIILYSGQDDETYKKGHIYKKNQNNWIDISLTGFSGKYEDLIDPPTLFSGNYEDLTNKPSTFIEHSLQNNIINTLSAQNTTLFYTLDGDVAIYNKEQQKLIKLSDDVISSFNQIETGNELATVNAISSFVKGYIIEEVDPIFVEQSGKFVLTSQIETITGNIISQVEEKGYALSSDVSGEIADIRNKVTSIFRFKGDVTESGLPDANTAEIGDVYVSGNLEYVCISGDPNNKWEQLGISIDLSNYATINYVDTTLSSYVKKNDNISDLTNDIGYITNSALNGYALSTEVNTLVSTTSTKVISQIEQKGYLTAHQSLDNYATTGWVEGKGYLTEHQSLTGYYDKDQISDISGEITSWVDEQNYVTEADLGLTGYVKVEDFKSISGKLTGDIDYVSGIVKNINDNYIQTSTVETLSTTLKNDINYISGVVALSTEVNTLVSTTSTKVINQIEQKGYLTAHQSLDNYALTSQLNSISTYLSTAIDYISGQVSGGSLTEEQDPIFAAQSGQFALTGDIPLSTSQLINDSGFLTGVLNEQIVEYTENIPQATSDLSGKVLIYSGQNTGDYEKGHIYKCQNSQWIDITDSVTGSSIEVLLFKVPQMTQLSQFMHFKIEFSDNDDFNNITYTLNTNDSSTYTSTNGFINGLKVFTGMEMIGFSISGIGSVFSNELIKLDLSITSGDYYRFQWLYGEEGYNELISGRFGYGQVNGVINIFDAIGSSQDSDLEQRVRKIEPQTPAVEYTNNTPSTSIIDFNIRMRWKIKGSGTTTLRPKNFVDGAEAYIIIYNGATVSWTEFEQNGNPDTSTGSNHFDSLIWAEGTAPRNISSFDVGFQVIKLIVVDNTVIGELIADTCDSNPILAAALNAENSANLSLQNASATNQIANETHDMMVNAGIDV